VNQAPIPAEILAIGDELTQGWNTDTNSSEIARELLAVGIAGSRITIVGDERAQIAAAFTEASRRAQVIVATGGLGPTEDDITREGAADALGAGQQFHAELWDRIVERFRARGRAIPESNKKQAFLPVGASRIPNANGTAPGFTFELNGAVIFVLPGVPVEMRAMLANFVLPQLRERFPGAARYHRNVVKCFGSSEAAIGEAIADLMARGADPIVGITVSRVTSTISIVSANEAAAARVAGEVAARLGPVVYSRRDEPIEQAVAQLLLSKNATIAVAESCTGGLAAAFLASVPGVSAVLKEGFVTYSNDAKIARLGVSPELLASHGAVSEECARAMAEGAREAAGADVGVGITGIAGPGGGTREKPVGLVFIAIALAAETRAARYNFAGLERNLLREIAARQALDQVRRAILGLPA
jgi:nicotinamide-nucleotide amidase